MTLAVFSSDRKYRYVLWRHDDVQEERFVMFIGLNPSIADELVDDPTIRRCRGFARTWGFKSFCMTNLFAYRATQPKDMLMQEDPVGVENDFCLQTHAKCAEIVVAVWGAHGKHRYRDVAVRAMLPKLHYLRLTKDGFPGHPLYLPATLTPKEWK